MSANLLVDLGNTTNFNPSSVGATLSASGGTLVGFPIDLINCDTYCNLFLIAPGVSGPIQVQVQCTPQGADNASGVLWSGGGFPVSGNFTDPTSGLAQLPTVFQSGANVYFNSGLYSLPGAGWGGSGQTGALPGGYPAGTFPFGLDPVYNAQGGCATALITSGGASGAIPVFASGGIGFAAFQRTGRWARTVVTLPAGVGGAGAGGSGSLLTVIAGFITQLDTTGSGGGFSWLPQSGGGNVALV